MDSKMKKLKVFISILLTIFLTTVTTIVYADCRGCCSRHGGVDCIDGVTKCRDGSPLSSKCKAKGCNKCGSTLAPTPSSNQTQESVKLYTPTKNSETFKCNGHVAYGIPGPEDQLLCREGYTVGYNYDRKIPTWDDVEEMW